MKANRWAHAVLALSLMLSGCDDSQPPPVPSGLAATATSASTIHLSWQDNSSNERAFTVDRGPSEAGPFSTIAGTPADATSYDDTALPPGTTYYYRVNAIGAAGSSGAVGPVSATTLGASTFTLTVQKDGAGTGKVTGTGISCGADCSEPLDPGTSATLTATPDDGSTFEEWTGCDSSSGSECTVTLSAAKTVTATFSASATATFVLTVQKNGTGTGTVTAAGISCGTDCAEPYDSGASVTLTATPGDGSTFESWSGCDSPTGPSCTVTMSAAKTVMATFSLAPTSYTLTLQKAAAAGTAGAGTITGAGIDCGTDCSEALAPNTSVTLTAATGTGSVLLGWTGCDSSTPSTCTVAMSAAKTVTASFLGPYTYTGSTLSGLRAVSPDLRFGDLTIAAGLVLDASDGASVTLAAANFTLPSSGSIRFTQSACSYSPPPDLSIISTRTLSLNGDILLDGKAGTAESSSTACNQCQGTRGGNLTLQGATIDVGNSAILVSGGGGSKYTFSDGSFYGCDGGAGGHLAATATGGINVSREAYLTFEGGPGGSASYGMPAGAAGADGSSAWTGNSVNVAERGTPGSEFNALVQNAQFLTYQPFTLRGAIYGPDDTAERGKNGSVVILGSAWSDFCEDLYVFQARTAQTLRFSLTGSAGDLDLYLVDPAITTIYAHSIGPTGTEAFSYDAAPGKYVLCISWVDGQPTQVASPVGYTVTVGH